MSFPTSPMDGQVYNNYEYNETVDTWNKVKGETFVSYHYTDTGDTVPHWQINNVPLGTTSYTSPAFPMIPAGAKRVKLRIYTSPGSTSTAGMFYLELKASDQGGGFPWHQAVGSSDVHASQNDHFTVDVALGADGKVIAYVNGSNISSISVHFGVVGWWI